MRPVVVGNRPQPEPTTYLDREALTTAALAYLGGGLSIIPVNARKKPALKEWTPYQKKQATREQVERWERFHSLAGFAAVCGEVSGGLTIIDFDVPGFYEKWAALAGELAQTLPTQRTGGGGEQVAFRSGLVVANDKLAWAPADNKMGREVTIETRGEGGYAVLPPSFCHLAEKRGKRHQHPYQAIQGDFTAVPTITDVQARHLIDVARSLCQAPVSKKQMQSAPLSPRSNCGAVGGGVIGRFNEVYAVGAILSRNGYQPRGNRYLAPDSTTGEPGVHLFEDGRCYSHHSNDPLNDGHSHNPFSVYCILEHGGDVNGAVKAAAAELGIERPQEGAPPDDGQAHDQAERMAIQGEAQAPNFPGIISAADLQNIVFPEIEYIVQDIIPFGFGLLSARPKKGKSYLALNVSASKATGGCALGSKELRLEPGKVLYIAYEDKKRRVKNRLTTIMQGESFPPKLYVSETWPRLPDGGLDRLDKWLSYNPDAKLVVIDTLGRFKPRKRPRQDDYEADLATGGALADLAHKHNVCILGVYHNRKTESDDPLDDVHGSTGMTAAADFVMVLRRGRGQADAELFVTGRDIEEKTLALRFHKNEGLWELLGTAEDVAKSKSRQDICLILKENDPMTTKELSEIIDKKVDTIKKLLNRMRVDNEVRFRNGKWELM